MKINPTQQYINQSYAANNTNTTANPSADQAKKSEEPLSDSINLSSTTRDLQKISAASAEEPKDRAQKVEDLKQQVESNQYTVNAEQVAEKMIGSIMDDVGWPGGIFFPPAWCIYVFRHEGVLYLQDNNLILKLNYNAPQSLKVRKQWARLLLYSSLIKKEDNYDQY